MTPPSVPDGMKRVMWAPKDIAAMTGKSIRTVYMWLERGQLGSKRVGRNLLIPVEEFDRFLADYQPAEPTKTA